MSIIPGWGRGGVDVAAPAVPVPKAYVFNGTDEGLVRTLVTSSPGVTRFTYSAWVKMVAFDASSSLWDNVFVVGNSLETLVNNGVVSDTGTVLGITGAEFEETADLVPAMTVNTWTHFVWSYDSPNATVGNRIRMYRNGTLLADDAFDPPGLNEAHRMFTNGFSHQIGMSQIFAEYANAKYAFIDCIDGLALDPTSFAFTNVSTWTRKKYTGSYGTYGFCLDGSDGFNDISGNAQHFTGFNMDATNISNADMPPFTN